MADRQMACMAQANNSAAMQNFQQNAMALRAGGQPGGSGGNVGIAPMAVAMPGRVPLGFVPMGAPPRPLPMPYSDAPGPHW